MVRAKDESAVAPNGLVCLCGPLKKEDARGKNAWVARAIRENKRAGCVINFESF